MAPYLESIFLSQIIGGIAILFLVMSVIQIVGYLSIIIVDKIIGFKNH